MICNVNGLAALIYGKTTRKSLSMREYILWCFSLRHGAIFFLDRSLSCHTRSTIFKWDESKIKGRCPYLFPLFFLLFFFHGSDLNY